MCSFISVLAYVLDWHTTVFAWRDYLFSISKMWKLQVHALYFHSDLHFVVAGFSFLGRGMHF
jgi:hypothetical protein